MLKVELDIFSGMPNPNWELSQVDKRQLIDRITADRSLILPFNAQTGGLGYRGFVVTAGQDHETEFKRLRLPRKFRLGGMGSADSARWLLNTPGANQTTADDVLQSAQDTATSSSATSPNTGLSPMMPVDGGGDPYPDPAPPADGGGEMSVSSDPSYDAGADTTALNYGYPQQDFSSDPGTPTYDASTSSDSSFYTYSAPCSWYFTSDTNFSFWNNDYYSLRYNNCYNFASNHKTYTFAQPGHCSGRYFSLDCGSMGTALYYDHFYSSCTGGIQNYAICLVIWPGRDFHFYRWCINNHWCHKPGQTAARNYDNSGYWITNPQYCNRGPYTIFCGYRYGSARYYSDLCIS